MSHIVAYFGTTLEDAAEFLSSPQRNDLEFVSLETIEALHALRKGRSLAAIILGVPGDPKLLSELYSKVNLGLLYGIQRIIVASSGREIQLARSSGYTANEYIMKPIDPVEFLRIIIDYGLVNKNIFGDMMAEPDRRRVTLRGADLPIGPTETRILLLLMGRPGRVFKRREIIEEVWGSGQQIDNRTVDVMVGRIRDTLRHKVTIDPIRTVRSVGYAFDEAYGAAKSRPRRGATMMKAL
jgi:DNA-binding winged helix-turn-helix (wHTH) protein